MKENQLPLQSGNSISEPAFYILLSLAPGKKHGYAILKDVEAASGGSVVLSTSTLYGALGRLQDQGLINRVPNGDPADITPGLPRKFYELSSAGRRILVAEMHRMQTLSVFAQQRLGEEN
jgi:DNA-binding PadR family transcriptional regulator